MEVDIVQVAGPCRMKFHVNWFAAHVTRGQRIETIMRYYAQTRGKEYENYRGIALITQL